MNKTLINVLKYLLGLGIGVTLLYFALDGIPFEEVKGYFLEANYLFVGLGMVIAVMSHWFRALRWQMLLRSAGTETKVMPLFASIMVGYLVNNAVPRAGEVTRATLTARTERIPFSKSMGTIFTDRIFDVIMLGLLAGTVFLIELDQFSLILQEAFAKQDGTDPAMAGGRFPWKWVILGLPVLGIAIFFAFKKQLMKIAIVEKLVNFVMELVSAVLSVRKMKNAGLFVFYTFAIWICYILMTYVCFFALEETSEMGFYFALIAFTLGGIGMVIPSPGGIGTYHYAFSLAFWGYWATIGQADAASAKALGTSLAFVIHTSQLVMMILLGFVCYLYLIPRLGKKLEKEETDAVSNAG